MKMVKEYFINGTRKITKHMMEKVTNEKGAVGQYIAVGILTFFTIAMGIIFATYFKGNWDTFSSAVSTKLQDLISNINGLS